MSRGGSESSTSARTYRGMLPEQRRADRRRRLLTAALEVFTSHGYHTARIEQLCSRASVSTRNFYEEFASKEEVLLTLHEQINSAGVRTVAAAMAELPDGRAPEARVDRLLDAFWDAVGTDSRRPRLAYLEAPGATPAMQLQHQVWVGRWAQLIETEARRATGNERDFRLVAVGLVGAITGLLREWHASPDPVPPEELRAAMNHLVLAAITMPLSK